MKILITGHKGFIGQNMVLALKDQHDLSFYEWGDPPPNFDGLDWCIHLGAISSTNEKDVEKVMKQNHDFSCLILLACIENNVNLQYASSASIYGMGDNFREDAPPKPASPYAWSKYLFDRWVFQQRQHIYVQGFRYFNVYGKYMHVRGKRSNAIHKWRQQARKEGKITVWENAENVKRDWTWVGDVCRLHIDFIKTVNGSGIWNCGSGLAHSFLDIAEEIAEQENVPIEFVPVPQEELVRFRHKTCADLTHLKETIGKRKWLNVFEFLAQ